MCNPRNQPRAVQETTPKLAITEPSSSCTQLKSHYQQVSYACVVKNRSSPGLEGNGSLMTQHSDYTPKNKLVPDSKIFRLVVHSINECPQGTACHTRFVQDNKSAGAVLSSIESITDQSIRDCFRLGKYSPDCNRPLLVHLNRSCHVVVILSKRRKLASSPTIRIKPALSLNERMAEKLLLMEHRRLIGAGIDHKQIKIQKDLFLIDNSLHALVKDSKHKLNEPTTSFATNQSSIVFSPTHHSLM